MKNWPNYKGFLSKWRMTCLYIRFTYPNDFLYGSQFCLKNCPQYSPFIWGTINDCGIANMLCSLCWVLLPPKIVKLSEMAKTLSFMRYLAFNDQFCAWNVLQHCETCSASIFFSKIIFFLIFEKSTKLWRIFIKMTNDLPIYLLRIPQWLPLWSPI